MEYKQLSSTTLEWSVLLSSLTHSQSGPVVHCSGNCISNCICHIVNGSNANCWCSSATEFLGPHLLVTCYPVRDITENIADPEQRVDKQEQDVQHSHITDCYYDKSVVVVCAV